MSGYYGNEGGGSGGSFYSNSNAYSQGQQQQQQQQYSSGYNYNNYSAQNVHQWQASAQQQQPQQQSISSSNSYNVSQPQQQQQQQQQPFLWNPAAAATMAAAAMSTMGSGGGGTSSSIGGAGGAFSNDAMFDLASSAGKSFLQNSTAKMIPGFEAAMLTLRAYFAVDNAYVLRKLKKVFVPYLSKQWKRMPIENYGPDPSTSGPQYELPTGDENAPDLYLPSMSLITYVLLCALCYGTAGKFEPEVIPDVTSTCFFTQLAEVLLLRFGFYMMQAPVSFLDLFSYTGYKYCGLCLNMLIGLLSGHFGFGARGYYVAFCWTASAAAYFMLKTMANNIPLVTAHTGPKREVMVLAFAASQLASMWLVSQTKFL